MFERVRPPRDPVTLRLDGRSLVAERGEPLAHSLLASIEGSVLARSAKLHRPRGPACLRGGCDGCLARVDGAPNVMTCQRPVRGGEDVHTQNVLGTRTTDLLRLTDWLFPRGVDHHHLFAGVPVASDLVASFARKLAGTGRLPDEDAAPITAERVGVDVLVVGGGLAGLTVAEGAAAGGRTVWLVDDGVALGGSSRAACDAARAAVQRRTLDAVEVRRGASVVGVFDEAALVVGEAGATQVTPRALVVAAGAHAATLAVPGNDLPGVLSARAVAQLELGGIAPSRGLVVVGDDPFADVLERRLQGRVRARVDPDDVTAILGTSRVEGVRLGSGREVEAGVVALALPGAPSFELGVQAGAQTRWLERGFAIETDPRGRAAHGVWAVGECAGAPFSPEDLEAGAKRAADDLCAWLDRGGDRAAWVRERATAHGG